MDSNASRQDAASHNQRQRAVSLPSSVPRPRTGAAYENIITFNDPTPSLSSAGTFAPAQNPLDRILSLSRHVSLPQTPTRPAHTLPPVNHVHRAGSTPQSPYTPDLSPTYTGYSPLSPAPPRELTFKPYNGPNSATTSAHTPSRSQSLPRLHIPHTPSYYPDYQHDYSSPIDFGGPPLSSNASTSSSGTNSRHPASHSSNATITSADIQAYFSRLSKADTLHELVNLLRNKGISLREVASTYDLSKGDVSDEIVAVMRARKIVPLRLVTELIDPDDIETFERRQAWYRSDTTVLNDFLDQVRNDEAGGSVASLRRASTDQPATYRNRTHDGGSMLRGRALRICVRYLSTHNISIAANASFLPATASVCNVKTGTSFVVLRRSHRTQTGGDDAPAYKTFSAS
ncbi:unnamed protein product [Peniophora sp. CBMAI 1063]|nr:unnamed protein product [Peniophora sp. CBMAI 1063]